jgi:hypothetical protein
MTAVLLPTATLFAAESSKTYASLEARLAPWMLDVLKDEGFTAADDAASLLFVGGRMDRAEKTQKIVDAIRQGTTIVYAVDTPTMFEKRLADFLPLNDWSIKESRLLRERVASGTLSLVKAYDLHLPGGAMENSQSRYLYGDYEKPLTNSDWRILASTANGMPLLLSSRTENAKVYVFGAAWTDIDTTNLANVRQNFIELLQDIKTPLERAENLSVQADIAVPTHQPDGLHVIVKNREQKRVRVALGYQVANWEREILNAETLTIELEAGVTKKIPLRERGLFKGDPQITEMGSSLPYRRIRVGLLGTNRETVVGETRHNVCVAKPVTLTLIDNADRWSRDKFNEEIEGGADGNAAKWFVWSVGSTPEVTVRIANRFVNLAPIAATKDETDPENKTIEGLNDLSLSRSDVRKEGLWNGYWLGKPLPLHRLSLRWEHEVVVAGIGMESFGTHRSEENALPKNVILKSGGKTFMERDEPEFVSNGSTMARRYFESFSPHHLTVCELEFTKFGQRIARINHKDTNCTIKELELFGWWSHDPVNVEGELEVIARNLVTGQTSVLKKERLSIPAYTATDTTIELPSHAQTGPVRYDFVYRVRNSVVASAQYDVFYIEEGREEIVNKKSLSDWEVGLLCTPGWVHHNNFGLGMVDWTQGWGGPHDKIWAMSVGVMETDFRRLDLPERMMTTNIGASHYTNPWRYMPDGTYGWNRTSDELLKRAVARNVKGFWVVGSDRWNGIPIGHSFGWDLFVRFDKHLRATTGEGLKSHGRKEIIEEIRQHHADRWQIWNLEEYAKKIDETQQQFAEQGINFQFETHGSFPFAGGELGDQLAETHQGVGTDLFWELRNQDLYWSLGTRFAVVAANPNLISGMYKQWGWINSESNMFWFANSGPAEPARRQWYSTYFMGRVDSKGEFHPYHNLGFSTQGSVSTRFYPHEIGNSLRTFNFTRFVRPEEPAGYGLVVSWDSHLRRMSPQAGTMGFGLYATGGADNQLEHRMGKLYEKLVKSGLPVGFVSSSHAMKNWHGKNPLVLLDASDWQGEELQTVSRLNANGAAIVGFGGDDKSPEALEFWTNGSEKRMVGSIEYYVRQRANSAPLIFCPMNVRDMPAADSLQLIDAIMEHCRLSFRSDVRLAVHPFVSRDALFIGLGSLSDQSSRVTMRFRPEEFAPQFSGKPVRIIDMDSFEVIVPDANGNITVPLRAVEGKMLMVTPR